MASKFRKVDPRFWKDERVRALTPIEKLVAFYVFTAQANRIGCFSFSPGMAAEDLGIPLNTCPGRVPDVVLAVGRGGGSDLPPYLVEVVSASFALRCVVFR
jgi:hypothetical protein